MLTTLSKYLNSQHKGKHISITPNSQLRYFVRKHRSPAEVQWRRKMKAEWFAVTLAAAFAVNVVYNVFPNRWIAMNIFMWDNDSMATGAKW